MRYTDADLANLRLAIAQSRLAGRHGDKPYGAVLVRAAGDVLHEARNTQVTEHDITGDAELNLLREASCRHGVAALRGSTVYASGEPCPMCAGTVYWSGATRVVFALDVTTMNRLDPDDADDTLPACRTILGDRKRAIEVHGPLLVDEAVAAFFDR
ncbi:MAG: nucleoside deaminase [Burkholderiales bacterium]